MCATYCDCYNCSRYISRDRDSDYSCSNDICIGSSSREVVIVITVVELAEEEEAKAAETVVATVELYKYCN